MQVDQIAGQAALQSGADFTNGVIGLLNQTADDGEAQGRYGEAMKLIRTKAEAFGTQAGRTERP